jgi:hypothetical protein
MPTLAGQPFDGFDWDHGNRSKCQKHGVSVAEIELLLQTTARFAPDLKHSASEMRLLAVGRDTSGRALFAAFTVRNRDDRWLVRPVSARYMHRKEIEGYEEEEGSQV